jgi:hypothetical protein
MPTATADLWSLNFFLVDLSLMLMHAWSPSIRLVHLHMFFTKKLLLFIQLLNRGTKKNIRGVLCGALSEKTSYLIFSFHASKSLANSVDQSLAWLAKYIYISRAATATEWKRADAEV